MVRKELLSEDLDLSEEAAGDWSCSCSWCRWTSWATSKLERNTKETVHLNQAHPGVTT